MNRTCIYSYNVAANCSRTATAINAIDDMAGKSIELGNKIFDPLGLANFGSEKTLKWFRASEVKHCRVAMVSCMC